MKFHYLTFFLATFLIGCSATPDVELTKENFEHLQTVRLEASKNDNSILSAISTIHFEGSGSAMVGGDGLDLKEKTLKFMDENQVSLNQIIQKQFVEKVKQGNLKVIFDDSSPNRLVITLNHVVLGKAPGFPGNFDVHYNITAQLLDDEKNILWSYTPFIPFIADGYSISLEELFLSEESMIHFFSSASEPTVQKLYEDFKVNLD
ncbi:hypothetical protein ACED63_20160 [Vibrio splendidus]|uniref:hypothetical protein n=1 Tax=Vibrio splendidus TaxID=29497 RepID=UPI00352C4EE3